MKAERDSLEMEPRSEGKLEEVQNAAVVFAIFYWHLCMALTRVTDLINKKNRETKMVVYEMYSRI